MEDRIRDLCAKVVAAPESELQPVLTELQLALRDHTTRLRQMVAENLAQSKPGDRSSAADTDTAHQDLKDTSTTE